MPQVIADGRYTSYLCFTKILMDLKVKETIAFIGEIGHTNQRLLYKLAEKGYPLVLVNKPAYTNDLFFTSLLKDIPGADIEIVHCEKECCWQADIILLQDAFAFDKEMMEKIACVAVQKILVRWIVDAEDIKSQDRNISIARQFPNSRWVWAILSETNNAIDMVGDDTPSLDRMSSIFSNTGYIIHSKERVDLVSK